MKETVLQCRKTVAVQSMDLIRLTTWTELGLVMTTSVAGDHAAEPHHESRSNIDAVTNGRKLVPRRMPNDATKDNARGNADRWS